uniref:Tetratricopeptide repeat protein 38 n=1 Tax=Leptocylindrus danicus TaxID=163516 RepID=A0A7S2PG96_9STRA
MQEVPVSDQIKDRTIVFSIVSGICLCLKWGTIKDDDSSTFEEQLVQRFIHEARLNGDAAHTSRALALQGVLLGRLGRYADAIQSHTELELVYDATKHSANISKSYGSDRAAQNWGLCAQWCDVQNDKEGAFKRIDFLVEHILPSQEERNIHNMFMILFPVIWVMKNHGKALQAKELFEGYIVKRFMEFYGKDGRFCFLRFFDIVLVLLELTIRDAGERNGDQTYEEMTDWVLEQEFAMFNDRAERLINLGRDGRSLVAEICLRLVRRPELSRSKRAELMEKGLNFARESWRYLNAEQEARRCVDYALRQVGPILEMLLWEEKNLSSSEIGTSDGTLQDVVVDAGS